jgi:hypothetical protein
MLDARELNATSGLIEHAWHKPATSFALPP